jgi:hypothetical protein
VRHAARPAGIPIGRALDVPAGIAYDDLREVIAAIDRVHGDGDLPSIPVRFVTGMISRGRFRFDETSGPISITLRAGQAHGGLTLVHEIGHFLDFAALGGATWFGSTFHPVMDDWRGAVAESRAYRSLEKMVRSRTGEVFEPNEGGRVIMLGADEFAALRRSVGLEELWACSYAQYVATRSGEASLVGSLHSLRIRLAGRVYYPRQWDDDDFEPIDLAVEALMNSMGWRA